MENEDLKRTQKRNRVWDTKEKSQVPIERGQRKMKRKIWREILGYATKRILLFGFTKDNEKRFVKCKGSVW